MKLFDLTGKTAIITGSTKGIGKAIAERMAEHGANVIISSRKQDACEEVTERSTKNGPTVTTAPSPFHATSIIRISSKTSLPKPRRNLAGSTS